ncbi:MAG TPA: GNAT family N-acetyltransferase [Burkholderiaceae bacterium]
MSAVTLRAVERAQWPVVENLMQFYNYELSAWYPIAFGPDGRYPIASRADYLGQPGTQSWLILVDDELAGFAVVDDELVDARRDLNLGYFFVGRRFRGRGVGAAAFGGLLARYPGAWELYYLARNEAAAAFWPKAFARAGLTQVAVSDEHLFGKDCVMNRFDAPVPRVRTCGTAH